MKTLKLAAFAVALGFFAASCGNSENTDATAVDTTVIEAPVETPAAPVEPTPVDTTTVAPATTDTTSAPAPAAH